MLIYRADGDVVVVNVDRPLHHMRQLSRLLGRVNRGETEVCHIGQSRYLAFRHGMDDRENAKATSVLRKAHPKLQIKVYGHAVEFAESEVSFV